MNIFDNLPEGYRHVKLQLEEGYKYVRLQLEEGEEVSMITIEFPTLEVAPNMVIKNDDIRWFTEVLNYNKIGYTVTPIDIE